MDVPYHLDVHVILRLIFMCWEVGKEKTKKNSLMTVEPPHGHCLSPDFFDAQEKWTSLLIKPLSFQVFYFMQVTLMWINTMPFGYNTLVSRKYLATPITAKIHRRVTPNLNLHLFKSPPQTAYVRDRQSCEISLCPSVAYRGERF